MNPTMYRQPRRAAIITDANEDIHTAFLLRRRRKIQFILTLFLALLSLTTCIFLLYLLNKEKEAVGSSTITKESHSPDYLCPDAVSLQSSIAEKVLRLHIRANSDLPCDQEVKLRVRDSVCSYLTIHMDAATKDEAKLWISEHMDEIISVAQKTLSQSGYDYPVSAKLTTANFPLRSYEDFFLPAGIYEALQIELGTGEGQNWWCILFPTLCLNNALVVREPDNIKTEPPTVPLQTTTGDSAPLQPAGTNLPNSAPAWATTASLSQKCEETTESARKLAEILEQNEFEAIQREHEKITFRFRILDLLREW